MQLADAAWRHTPEGAEVDDAIWAAALREVRVGAAEAPERLFSHFQRAERDVLRVMDKGAGDLHHEATNATSDSESPASAARSAWM